jgi:hypothetical protein
MARDRCTCKDEPQEEHECPYQCEIHNNDAPFCTCCEACERQCMDDV